MLQDAVMQRLEIIGEAVKTLPDDFRATHHDIPWKEMAGLRDVLIHAYFRVNIERVWNVIKNELPGIKRALETLLQNLPDD